MYRLPFPVEGNRRNNRYLVLRSSTSIATRSFSPEIGIINLDVSFQNIGFFPRTHGPHDLALYKLRNVIVDA